MFNERKLHDFLTRFPDHRIEITGIVVDGKPVWQGKIVGPDGDEEEVVVAEAIRGNLADMPCAMADDLRNKLGHAQQVEDKSKLPASQRTALEEGIPGIVRHRGNQKPIVPTLPHGAREG